MQVGTGGSVTVCIFLVIHSLALYADIVQWDTNHDPVSTQTCEELTPAFSAEIDEAATLSRSPNPAPGKPLRRFFLLTWNVEATWLL